MRLNTMNSIFLVKRTDSRNWEPYDLTRFVIVCHSAEEAKNTHPTGCLITEAGQNMRWTRNTNHIEVTKLGEAVPFSKKEVICAS